MEISFKNDEKKISVSAHKHEQATDDDLIIYPEK